MTSYSSLLYLDAPWLVISTTSVGISRENKPMSSSINFPAGWDITFTENHWSNEETTRRYITNILLPYLDQTKKELKLDADHHALLIFDNFKGQCTENMLTFLDSNNVNVVLIPPNCTDRL